MTTPVNDPHGWTPLMVAADAGDLAAVTRLLAEGADQQAPRRRLSPQRLAMRSGHVAVLRVLQRHGGDQLGLARPPGASPETVVLRWAGPRAAWAGLFAIPPVVGLLIDLGSGSSAGLVSGLAIALFTAAVTALVVGLNGMERFAFDEHRFWHRSVRTWQGPIDLRHILVAYLVKTNGGPSLYLLQTDAGVPVWARESSGFDPETVARLNAEQSLRSVAMMANTSSLYPGYLAYLAGYILEPPTMLDEPARRLLTTARRTSRNPS